MFGRILILLGSVAALGAAENARLTLEDAIRVAWRNDPAMAAFALTPELARAREIQAGIRPNPELELQGSTAAPFENEGEWAVGLGVKQQLPRRDRVERARAVARLGGDSAPLQRQIQRARVAADVRRHFYDLAVHRARLDLAQLTVEAQGELQAASERLQAAGELAAAEIHFLSLETARAEQALALAAAELIGVEQRLRGRLRWPPQGALELATDLDALLLRSPPDASADALGRRPELALATLAVREAEAGLALAMAESRADWTVGGGLEYERRANDATGRLEDEPRLAVHAAIPWPRRVANRGVILERQAAVRMAEAERDALHDHLMTAARTASAALAPLRDVLLQQRDLLSQTANLSEELGRAYERGEVTTQQLAQSRQQRAALESDFLLTAARYATALAEAEIAAGLLPDDE